MVTEIRMKARVKADRKEAWGNVQGGGNDSYLDWGCGYMAAYIN